MNKRIVLRFFSILLIFPTILACTSPFGIGSGNDDQAATANLAVSIGGVGASSIIPDVEGLVTEYLVTLSRDGFDDISDSGAGPDFEFTDVTIGTWNVSVVAKDGNGATIGSGGATTEVTVGGINSVQVSVAPTVAGSGSIDLTVTWPAGSITEVGDATIGLLGQPPVEITGDIDVDADTAEARYTATHPSGVYELVVLLERNGSLVASLVEAVHVYDNVATTATISLTDREIGQPPIPPTDPVAVAGVNTVTLTWTDASPVNDRYEIQRKEGGDDSWQDLRIDPPLSATAHRHTDTTAAGGATYHYRIRGTNSFGPFGAEEGWVEFDPVTPTLPVAEGTVQIDFDNPDNPEISFTGATDTLRKGEVVTVGADGGYTGHVWRLNGQVSHTALTATGSSAAIDTSHLDHGTHTVSLVVTEGYSAQFSFNVVDSLRLSVTYHGNGADSGSAPIDINEYEPGDNATVLGAGTLADTHYAFESWNTSADGSGTRYAAGSEISVTGDVDLYARWLPFSGNPVVDGWVHAGHSMEQGLYAKGSGNYGYDIYTYRGTVGSAADLGPEVFRHRHHEDNPGYYSDFYEGWDPFTQDLWETGDSIVGIGGVFRTESDPTALGWPAGTIWSSSLPTNGSLQAYRLAVKLSPSDHFAASTSPPPNSNGNSSLADHDVYVHGSEWTPVTDWIAYSGDMMGVQDGSSNTTQVVAIPYGATYEGDRNAFRFLWTYDEVNRRPASWQIIINETLYAEWVAANQAYGAGWSIESAITSVQFSNNAYTDARLGPEVFE
jgi:hypothetical protein